MPSPKTASRSLPTTAWIGSWGASKGRRSGNIIVEAPLREPAVCPILRARCAPGELRANAEREAPGPRRGPRARESTERSAPCLGHEREPHRVADELDLR